MANKPQDCRTSKSVIYSSVDLFIPFESGSRTHLTILPIPCVATAPDHAEEQKKHTYTRRTVRRVQTKHEELNKTNAEYQLSFL